eukprot:gene8339-163_t
MDHQMQPEQSWKEIKTGSDIKPKHICSTVVLHQNFIYVYGGYDEDTISTTEDFFKFNLISKQWDLVNAKNSPGPRMGHSSIMYDGNMYLFSGWNHGGKNDLWKFDFETLSWEQINYNSLYTTKNRYYHSSIVYKNHIYFIFGLLSDNRARTNQMLKFNPETSFLTQIDNLKGDIPSDRSGITPIVYSDQLFIYGGYGTNAERFNDLYSFNFETKTWKFIKTTGEFPVKTSGQCGVKYEAFIYIFGGSYGGDSSGSYSKEVLTYTNNFYKYDLTSHIWKKLEYKNSPCPRSFSDAFIYEDTLYIFGGTDNVKLRNEVWKVQIGKGIYGNDILKNFDEYTDVVFKLKVQSN